MSVLLAFLDWYALLASAAGLGGLVGAAEGLRVFAGVSATASRRLVHVGVGLFVAATPWFFDGPGGVYLLALLFAGINLAAWTRGWLLSIHGARRRSFGTVAFPLSVLPALAVTWSLDPGRVFAFQTAYLVLALADPAAAWAGQRPRRAPRLLFEGGAKTVRGTAAFVVSAFVLAGGALLGFWVAGEIAWSGFAVVGAAAAAAVAGVTGAVEALGRRGWDNLFIAVAAVVVLVVFDEAPDARGRLMGAVAAGVAFGWGAHRARFLATDGAVAGGLLAASIVGMGGWAWVVPALAFFVLSSLLSKLGAARKKEAAARSEGGAVRSAAQVYANGGVAWGCLVLQAVYPLDLLWYAGFLGAFAAAAADTWATEIGTLARGRPISLRTGRRVPRGSSGAVSLVGTLGAVGGALSVALAAWAVADLPVIEGAFVFGLVMASGVAAAFVDSLLGAWLQARYYDAAAGAKTERPRGAGGAHRLVRGRRGVTNDRVNALCTLAGALLAMLGVSLL